MKCPFCWKYMDKAVFGDMTGKQVDKFCKYMGHLKPKFLRITGGDPLVHPKFMDILLRLRDNFKDSVVQVLTNGLLLEESMFIDRVKYVVTPYPHNASIRERFWNKISVYERPHGYFDREHDPNLNEKQARDIHKKCLYKQIRVIGDSVYDCCHAETLERLGRCGNVHVPLDENWEENINRERWQECVHCFVGDGGKKDDFYNYTLL